MDRAELRELIQGPIATVPTPFDDDFEVDFGRMHELTQQWVDEGLVKGKAVIKVAAAMGEGPMLKDEEWPLAAPNGRAGGQGPGVHRVRAPL